MSHGFTCDVVSFYSIILLNFIPRKLLFNLILPCKHMSLCTTVAYGEKKKLYFHIRDALTLIT